MKLGENLTEKPPIDGEAPPQYSSTVDLCKVDLCKVAPAPDSVSVQSVKCESKHPRRRRLLKILGVVGVVALIAILFGFVVKFAVRDDRGDSDDELRVYSVQVRNVTGDYRAVVGLYYNRVMAIKDSRRSVCYLYFPQGDRHGFIESLFKHHDDHNDRDDDDDDDDDHDRSPLTLTYKMAEEAGFALAVRTINEPISSRVVAAATGKLISQFCMNHTPFFMEAVYGATGEYDDDDIRNSNILIVTK